MVEERAASCGRAQVTLDQAAPRLVGDVMIKRPKTLSGEATAGEARRLFADPKLISLLLVDGSDFGGVLDREDLPASAPDAAPVRPLARRDVVTITPDRPVSDALAVLERDHSSRMVVIGDDGGTLVGLLCLDRSRSGFCQG